MVEKGWVQNKRTFFIFDEAQLSYKDFDLWTVFFKNMQGSNDRFAIAFASYGSPSSLEFKETTPFAVSDSQRVTLRPIDHGDGSSAVGLLFNETEFKDLVAKRFPQSHYYFHLSFFGHVFDLTCGHVGAIHDLIRLIVAHDVRFFMMSKHIT